MGLCDQSLSGFYAEYTRWLGKLGVSVTIDPVAVEMPDRVLLDRDPRLCLYDAGADPDGPAARGVSEEIRGQVSPIHFFRGACDLAAARLWGQAKQSTASWHEPPFPMSR
jgi:hypothetical protein